MAQFIEVTACEDIDNTTHIKKVSINPEYIISITDNNGHALIRMSDSSVIKTVESHEEINFMLIDQEKLNTYIKG